MKKAIRKSITSMVLLSILFFSLIAYISPLANADPVGIGKYVDIEVIGGGGSVTLTKVSSGEYWDIDTIHPFNDKLGAGLVELEAFTDGNFVFDYWIIGFELDESGFILNGEELSDTSLIDFRTRKGTTYVEAYFTEVIYYTVTAVVSGSASDGIITIGIDVYTVDAPFVATVEKDTELTFGFVADLGYHISAITLNGVFQSPDEYLPLVVDDNYDIVVFFSEDGYAFVPSGADVEVYFTQSASLYFENAIAQVAGGIELIRPWGYFVWDINAIIDEFTGEVIITLRIDLGESIPENFGVIGFTFDTDDEENAFYCDVNGDLIVSAADLSLVANYNRLSNRHPHRYPYDSTYDTNRDGEITSDDIQLVQDYFGTQIEYDPVPWDYDPATQTLTIFPEHFSIFRGR